MSRVRVRCTVEPSVAPAVSGRWRRASTREVGVMKTIAIVLFLAPTVFMAGCSAYRSFTYSSPEGKTCLTKCENARWACKDRCGADTICADDCERTAKACRKSCPEISTVEPDNTY